MQYEDDTMATRLSFMAVPNVRYSPSQLSVQHNNYLISIDVCTNHASLTINFVTVCLYWLTVHI